MCYLGDRNDEERPSSAGFDDHSDEFRVDGTEGAVPGHTRHPDVVDAVLALPRLGEDVAELALPDHPSPERHICDGRAKNHGKLEVYRQVTVKPF